MTIRQEGIEWAHAIVTRMLAVTMAGGDPSRILDEALATGDTDDLASSLEYLNEWAEVDVQTLESLQVQLLDHPELEIRCAAMRGLYHLGRAQFHLPMYRDRATDAVPEVRDAAAYGLGASLERCDEEMLWTLFYDDDYNDGDGNDDVKMSAAYALRDMPRAIDAELYAEGLANMTYGGCICLAERALKDERLFDITRAVLSDQWPDFVELGWHKLVPGLAEALGFEE